MTDAEHGALVAHVMKLRPGISGAEAIQLIDDMASELREQFRLRRAMRMLLCGASQRAIDAAFLGSPRT